MGETGNDLPIFKFPFKQIDISTHIRSSPTGLDMERMFEYHL